MTLEAFTEKPWSQVHPTYAASFLHMRPAPEYASGEVVLASTYRAVGFGQGFISEGEVPGKGRALQKQLDSNRTTQPAGAILPVEVWKNVVCGILRSPKQPNQTAKRFLQISPVVPDSALYSQSARLSANSWNPGELVSRVIQFGEADLASAQQLWGRLFHALDVGDGDDIWARFLQAEFHAWRSPENQSGWRQPGKLQRDPAIEAWHRNGIRAIPACRFVKDLDSILGLKDRLTRRQWTSMLETILRIGTVSHVLWICRANTIFFSALWDVLHGRDVPGLQVILDCLGPREGFWRYGQLAAGAISDLSTNFLKARAGMNLFLYFFPLITAGAIDCLESPRAFVDLLGRVASARRSLDILGFARHYEDLLGSEQRAVSGKKGIASNIREFARHVLGQRQTAEPGLDSYDQGYFLRKRGAHASAPWQVSLGPVAVMGIVHACTHGARTPRNLNDLCRHFSEYGIDVRAQDFDGSRLGLTLRNLGLVIDSPDAEGGMVIKNPFEQIQE